MDSIWRPTNTAARGRGPQVYSVYKWSIPGSSKKPKVELNASTRLHKISLWELAFQAHQNHQNELLLRVMTHEVITLSCIFSLIWLQLWDADCEALRGSMQWIHLCSQGKTPGDPNLVFWFQIICRPCQIIWWVLGLKGLQIISQHPPVHYPLETLCDTVVDEPQLNDQCSTLVTSPVNPPSQSHSI